MNMQKNLKQNTMDEIKALQDQIKELKAKLKEKEKHTINIDSYIPSVYSVDAITEARTYAKELGDTDLIIDLMKKDDRQNKKMEDFTLTLSRHEEEVYSEIGEVIISRKGVHYLFKDETLTQINFPKAVKIGDKIINL